VPQDPPNVPLEQQASPTTAGLPSFAGFDPSAPFWRPSLGELFRHLGWRNVLFLPALGLLAFFVACFFEIGLLPLVLSAVGMKLAVLAVAVPVALCGWAVGAAVRSRKDPFCSHCGQCLLGLPAIYNCPECGRPYDLRLLDDYRRDPQWFIQRWRARYDLPAPDAQVVIHPNAPRRKSRDGT
jgi:hypothetical protein